MSKRDRRKDKHGNFSESSKSNYNEGTAARTRPFSVEEIMLRRKHKKSVEEVKVLFGEASESSKIKDAEREAAHSKPDGGYAEKKDNHLRMDKHVSEDTSKEIISKKEENKSIRVDHSKVKEKGNNDSEANLRIKSSKDEGIRYKDNKSGKQIRPRKKADDHVRVEMEGEAELKHTKGSITVKERHVEREKKSHRESKRKHIEEADHQHRSEMDGAITKKHDSGRRRDSETLEMKNRKKESSHYEESRSRRRRSRSRDRDQDRDRSTSLSPRAYKQMSFRGRDYGDSSFHSTRDRSGRQYFNGDKHRISDNKKYASGGYRRYGGSGLGGYSPRKRRSEAAIKTPSPTVRSPEKKSGAWDLPPAEKDQTSFQSFQEAIPESVNQVPTAFPAVSIPLKSQPGDSSTTLSVTKSESIDSIQLTQGTRPMRRLYVENIPASASDKAVLECFNEFFMSSGANHIQGANPCISCIVNKEKNQALVEFLTPEDATTALSFSGRPLSGSTIKIRRPKDIIDATTGVLEKPISMPVVDAISSVVKDSLNKIFVGGISKTLSSEMLVEICSAFGLLKAYHFEDNEALNQSCAFLEYVDHSITHKACAGLNGMKLGGNILTVVQATPDSYAEEIDESPPFYGIPEHAKPLLENPTRVLKFQNLFNQEDLSLMSEPELEEALEDIRLECARFGTVKSFNFISYEVVALLLLRKLN
ncbi:hypothetical protein QJS10_CPB20g00885 [Acorus calamus]|uniref:RRM domain-containing protein n=1 Tax=Acorus calamus TaxID=4465 RepID=A0AAV9CCW5_ACOCL|nr:hypothetical protein QJS10_CPB20g00885 [Acorus calamus]